MQTIVLFFATVSLVTAATMSMVSFNVFETVYGQSTGSGPRDGGSSSPPSSSPPSGPPTTPGGRHVNAPCGVRGAWCESGFLKSFQSVWEPACGPVPEDGEWLTAGTVLIVTVNPVNDRNNKGFLDNLRYDIKGYSK